MVGTSAKIIIDLADSRFEFNNTITKNRFQITYNKKNYKVLNFNTKKYLPGAFDKYDAWLPTKAKE
jgi:hypothetical protein